jgi:hypothetical protein
LILIFIWICFAEIPKKESKSKTSVVTFQCCNDDNIVITSSLTANTVILSIILRLPGIWTILLRNFVFTEYEFSRLFVCLFSKSSTAYRLQITYITILTWMRKSSTSYNINFKNAKQSMCNIQIYMIISEDKPLMLWPLI